jgi:hypothetical protein
VGVGLRGYIGFGPGRQGADVQGGKQASGVHGFGVHGDFLKASIGQSLIEPRRLGLPRWNLFETREVSRLCREQARVNHYVSAQACDTQRYKTPEIAMLS